MDVRERLNKAEERLLFGLRQRSVREERGLFLAEGVRVIEELVASGMSIEQAVVSPSIEDTPRGSALLPTLEGTTTVRRVPEGELRRLASTDTPQGVIAVARIPRHQPDTLFATEPALLLVLDAVQDPGNFGALVRSAHAFGATGVVAMAGTVDPWNPKAVRAAAGSSFHVPILQAETQDTLARLRGAGYQVLAADSRGTSVEQVRRSRRMALIVGNEGAGLSQAVSEAANEMVSVPHRGNAESLNVAVAAGILLYVLSRND